MRTHTYPSDEKDATGASQEALWAQGRGGGTISSASGRPVARPPTCQAPRARRRQLMNCVVGNA